MITSSLCVPFLILSMHVWTGANNFYFCPGKYLSFPSMALQSTLFCLLLSILLVSGNLLPSGRKIKRPGKEDPEEKRKAESRIQGRKQKSVSSQVDQECQEGNPLGASYLGKMNSTSSGRTCQVWSASQPHQHNTHNTKYILADRPLSSKLNPCSSPSNGHVPASPWTPT